MTIYLVFEPEDRSEVFRFATRSKERAYLIAGQYDFDVVKTELDVEDFEYELDGLSMYRVEIMEGPCGPYQRDDERRRAWPVTELPHPLTSIPWNGKDPQTGVVHKMTIRAKSPDDAIDKVLVIIEGNSKNAANP